jgi:hypothetical protein
MSRQPNYWIVSPNIGRHEKRSEAWMVEAWKKIIRDEEVVVMGWGINEDRQTNPGGYIIGQRFAGIGDPSVQLGDVVFIARGRVNNDPVAVGVVASPSWEDDRFLDLHNGQPVQMRKLKNFRSLEGEDVSHLPLEKALPARPAMSWKPLNTRFNDPDIKKLCKWLDKQVESARDSEASRRKNKYGIESVDHDRLKEWCANHPEQLGLESVLEVPGAEEFYVCDPHTNDRCDVCFKMQGDRYAVIEVETNNPLQGVYQALKYKTLLCAKQGYEVTDGRVEAILVAWKIPSPVRGLCVKYGIKYHENRV